MKNDIISQYVERVFAFSLNHTFSTVYKYIEVLER